MSIIIPGSRQNVQIGSKEKVCVLVHHSTGRILCFCLDDPFAAKFTDAGYLKIEINHAHEYDLWAKRIRDQAKIENEVEDAAYLERENVTRQKLRGELRSRLNELTDGVQKKAVEQAIHCLDFMEARRKRYREESFHVQEAFEQSTAGPGEEIVNKVMRKPQ